MRKERGRTVSPLSSEGQRVFNLALSLPCYATDPTHSIRVLTAVAQPFRTKLPLTSKISIDTFAVK